MAQEKRRFALTRHYANARDVLPSDLLETVRELFAGLIWEPGDSTGYEEPPQARSQPLRRASS